MRPVLTLGLIVAILVTVPTLISAQPKQLAPDLSQWKMISSHEFNVSAGGLASDQADIGQDVFVNSQASAYAIPDYAIVYRLAGSQARKFVFIVKAGSYNGGMRLLMDFYTLSDDGLGVLIHETRVVSTRDKDAEWKPFQGSASEWHDALFPLSSATGKAFLAWAAGRGERPLLARGSVPSFTFTRNKNISGQTAYLYSLSWAWIGVQYQPST